jgi:hypothetical protein
MNAFEYDPDGFDIESFRDVIHPHWTYHSLCQSLNWAMFAREDGSTQIEICPPYQLVYGGPDDGKMISAPFEFDIFGFLGEEGIEEIEKVGVVSYSEQGSHGPFLGIVGSFRGKPFSLRIHLEPQPETDPHEIVDRIKNEVRKIEEETW